jgi:hypothetical protein
MSHPNWSTTMANSNEIEMMMTRFNDLMLKARFRKLTVGEDAKLLELERAIEAACEKLADEHYAKAVA